MNLDAATEAVKHKLGTTWPEPTLTEASREIAVAVAPHLKAAALREAADLARQLGAESVDLSWLRTRAERIERGAS